MKKVYITGVSGTGKTTISRALNERGIQSVSIDEANLCSWFNRADGSRVDYDAKMDRAFIDSHTWICDVGQVKDLMNTKGAKVFIGFAANQDDFLHLFDKVILLQCEPETFLKRVRERNDNDFGKDETAQKYLLDTYKIIEGSLLSKGAIPVNVDRPLDEVIEDIIREIE